MLHRLIYASEASRPLDLATVSQLVAQARTTNARRDITGALAFDAGKFLQALEGSRETLSALYGRLAADDRHKAVMLIEFRPVAERAFLHWDMAFAAANERTSTVFRRYTSSGRLSPAQLTPESALCVLRELVALPEGGLA